MSLGDWASVVAAIASSIGAALSLYQYFKEKRDERERNIPRELH